MEIRRWDATRNGWWVYDGGDKDEYLARDFYYRVSFSGRKCFERLHAQAAEASRVDRMPVARLLAEAEHQASLRELKEAHSDLTKRPEPDLTGVVQHCVAALECTAKLLVGNDGGTLGDVLKDRKLNLPPHLSEMLKKAWGFASDRGRLVKEGKPGLIRLLDWLSPRKALTGLRGKACACDGAYQFTHFAVTLVILKSETGVDAFRPCCF